METKTALMDLTKLIACTVNVQITSSNVPMDVAYPFRGNVMANVSLYILLKLVSNAFISDSPLTYITADCSGGEDERSCHISGANTCDPSYFRCNNSKCNLFTYFNCLFFNITNFLWALCK